MFSESLLHKAQSVWQLIVTAPTPSMSIVVLMVSFLLCLFLLRLVIRRHRIRVARVQIPFVIGGWGTRGKSGTERKKAALFEGLGYHVTGKTTGCEAMMIHARPGQEGVELPIYRPGDKATIWEQGKVVEYASSFGSQVFLWECMALGPDYASTLQHDWMNDDYSTLSNTFVDHENVQGPTGMDVTNALTSFIPENGHLFTAEEMMLPVIEQVCRNRKTEIHDLKWHESDLIGDDVLEQFPYTVHPRNLGMVLKLARHLNIDDTVALREICRNIIPDLGSFKQYKSRFKNRYLEFWNGMSANDRMSTVSNWEKAGFYNTDPDNTTWTVTVVNNRDDRIIRSREFSEIIVNDTPANLHVLIGTNLTGLQGYLIEAIKEFASRKSLVSPTAVITRKNDTLENLRKRILKQCQNLKVNTPDITHLTRKLAIMIKSDPDQPVVQDCIKSLISLNEPSQKKILQHLDSFELKPEVKEDIATQLIRDLNDFHAVTNCLTQLEDLLLESENSSVNTEINRIYRALIVTVFKNRLLVLNNPNLSGDNIINQITRNSPPNYMIKIMGMQNIKGTGLDFAYRWVSLAKVQQAIGKLSADNQDTLKKGLDFLFEYDDYGILDAPVAIKALRNYRKKAVREQPEIIPQVDESIGRIQKALDISMTRLKTQSRFKGFRRTILWLIEQLHEAGDSQKRKHQVNQIMADLFNQRISHVKAKKLLHDIKSRQDGGWLQF